MKINIVNPVSDKFSDLIHALNYVADDIKIACAEASLDGDFTKVAELFETSRQIQAFIKDASDLSNRWDKDVLESTTSSKQTTTSLKQTSPPKKMIAGKKPRSKLCVTIDGQQIQCDTAADTFVATLEIMGFERVESLQKKLSGIPLLSKTRPTGYQNNKQCGAWFVTTHSSTRDMKNLLEKLGAELRIPVQIAIVSG
jgi:hypothetical protein